MEKVIKLIMSTDKSIKILVDDVEKSTIDVQNRSISAALMYEILEFTIGDQYSVVSENEEGVDDQVLQFFTDLFIDVTKKVNAIGSKQ